MNKELEEAVKKVGSLAQEIEKHMVPGQTINITFMKAGKIIDPANPKGHIQESMLIITKPSSFIPMAFNVTD